MVHARFSKHRPLGRTLLALFAGTMWCTLNVAYGNESVHWHDRVTITGSPASSVAAGQTYSFTPSATDSYGRALVFAISNKPSWATFSSTSGQLSGTPDASSVGTYLNIVIAVSDGWRNATLPAFAIQVQASSSAGTGSPLPPPTISGTPSTSDVAGSAYSFQPTASGPSGTTLAFSVQSKPSWATFSIATGQLSGTPGATDVGTYAGIVISVNDGTASASLPSFSIVVTGATGNANLSWTTPTLNTDGTPLTDLAGYTISYGTSPTALAQSVSITNPTATAYTITGLSAGTWYFSISANANNGTHSSASPVANATIS